MVLELGIDIGYSGTKAAADDVLLVQFASFEADIPDSKGDDLFKKKAEHLVQLTFNGTQVEKLVGNAALRTSSARGMLGQVEKVDNTHDLLLFTAAYLLGELRFIIRQRPARPPAEQTTATCLRSNPPPGLWSTPPDTARPPVRDHTRPTGKLQSPG